MSVVIINLLFFEIQALKGNIRIIIMFKIVCLYPIILFDYYEKYFVYQ